MGWLAESYARAIRVQYQVVLQDNWTHHDGVALRGEDLEVVDGVRLVANPVGFDDRELMSVDRKDEVGIARIRWYQGCVYFECTMKTHQDRDTTRRR